MLYTSFKIAPYHLDTRKYVSKIKLSSDHFWQYRKFFNYTLLGPGANATVVQKLLKK